MNKVIMVGKIRTVEAPNGASIKKMTVRLSADKTEDIPVWIPPDISTPDSGAYLWVEGSLYVSNKGFLGIRVSSWRTLDGKARSSRVSPAAPAPGTEDNVPF